MIVEDHPYVDDSIESNAPKPKQQNNHNQRRNNHNRPKPKGNSGFSVGGKRSFNR